MDKPRKAGNALSPKPKPKLEAGNQERTSRVSVCALAYAQRAKRKFASALPVHREEVGGLTPRSRRGPTASHQARLQVRLIILPPGLASRRRSRLTSNVRPHNMQPKVSSDYGQYQQPPWSTSVSVEAAIGQVAVAASEVEASAAYEAVLNAVGNNHAGTYYPVALAVIPDLGLHIEFGGPWAQHSAVQVLLDLTGSFQPEPGCELFSKPGTAAGISLRAQLREQVQGLSHKLQVLARHGRPGSAGAQELLELVGSEA